MMSTEDELDIFVNELIDEQRRIKEEKEKNE